MDVGHPTLHRIEAVRRIHGLSPRSKRILVSHDTSAEIVREAFRIGLEPSLIKRMPNVSDLNNRQNRGASEIDYNDSSINRVLRRLAPMPRIQGIKNLRTRLNPHAHPEYSSGLKPKAQRSSHRL